MKAGMLAFDECRGKMGEKLKKEEALKEKKLQEKYKNKFAFKKTLKKLLNAFPGEIREGDQLTLADKLEGNNFLKVVIKSYRKSGQYTERVMMEVFHLQMREKPDILEINPIKLWGYFWLEYGEEDYFVMQDGVGPIILTLGAIPQKPEDHLQAWMEEIESSYLRF